MHFRFTVDCHVFFSSLPHANQRQSIGLSQPRMSIPPRPLKFLTSPRRGWLYVVFFSDRAAPYSRRDLQPKWFQTVRVPNSCNIPNLSFNPVNFTCCHEKNLLAQGQNNTHYTCSRGKYCRLVQFDQSYSLSSCQECYQKAKIQYWLEIGVFFCRFFVHSGVSSSDNDGFSLAQHVNLSTNSVPRCQDAWKW